MRHALLLLIGCTAGEDTDEATLAADATPIVTSSTACAACDGACTEDELVYPARYHAVADVPYTDLPPAGGPHDRCWAAWGFHENPVQDDNFVHNLEHGGVAVLWNCTDCDAEQDAIRTWIAAHDRTVGTAYADLPTRFALVAWEARQLADCFDPAAADDFYTRRFDQAPESVGTPPPDGCMDQ